MVPTAQEVQDLTMFSTSLFRPGQKTYDLSNCSMRTITRCPLCSVRKTLGRNISEITSLSLKNRQSLTIEGELFRLAEWHNESTLEIF